MKVYKALTKEGFPIVTVLANDEDEARRAITEQLDRPGRYGQYQQWLEGGKRVQEKR